MPKEIPPSVRIPHRRIEAEVPASTFESFGVVGAKGQTGRLYTEKISSAFSDMPIAAIDLSEKAIEFDKNVTFSTDLALVLQQENRPDALILATTNPTDKLLDVIKNNVGDRPLTLILPQNGVDVVGKAQQALAGKNVTLIRASMFSPVDTNPDGSIKYNKDKLRIGLSLTYDNPDQASDKDKAELQKAKALFERSGFDAKTFEDYKAMEWTKLLLNSIGSTSEVTGLTPEETFSDPKLRKIELQAIADRLRIMRAAGIKYEKIHWGGAHMLPLLDKPVIKQFRNHWPLAGFITDLIASGRENKPSASGQRILKGAMPDETEIPYYHQPFIDLAKEHGLSSPVDEAIVGIMDRYPKKIDLMHMAPKDKRAILLSNARRKKSLIEKLAGTDLVASISRDLLLKTVRTDIRNTQHLKEAKEILKKGSLIVLTDHVDTLDSIAFAKAIREFADYNQMSVFIADKHFNEERVPLEGALMHGWSRTAGFDFMPMVQVDDKFHSETEAASINLGSLRKALRKLKQTGQVLGLVPEGTRSDTGGLLKGEDGIELFLRSAGENVWVLPIVAVHGKIRPLKTRTTVIVGKPYNCREMVQKSKAAGTSLVNDVMLDMASYLPEENRGYYRTPQA